MMSVKDALALLGVFLPILGLIATFLVAWSFKPGPKRWAVLAAGPVLTLLVFVAFLEPISEIGHMLAVAMFLGLVVFLVCYYPVLIVIGLVTWWRGR